MNIAELNRRLDNLIRYGVIEQVDFATDPVQPRVRVKTGEILTKWIPIATSRANADAEHDPVQVGEHVILLAPSGELTQAVVIGKLFSTDHPSPDLNPNNHRRKYRDGCVIEYNSETHHLNATLPEGGTVKLVATGGITFVGDITHIGNLAQTGSQAITGDITLTGSQAATGNITSDSDISAGGNLSAAGDATAGGVSLSGHVHGGVEPGDGSTGGPA